MSNNKKNQGSMLTFIIAILITIILAALKLDGVINITWIYVVSPIVIYMVFDLIVSLAIWIGLLIGAMKIHESIKENNRNKCSYNNNTYGRTIYWDYKTQSMYDATGNKIGNYTINEEEQN